MEEILSSFGFNENEINLYLSVLKLGEGTVADFVKISPVKRTNAYAIMNRFVEMGLVAEVSGKPKRFRCVPPQYALENLLNARVKEIEHDYHQKHVEIESERNEMLKRFSKPNQSMVKTFIKEASKLYDEDIEFVTGNDEIIILRGEKGVSKVLHRLIPKRIMRTFTKPPIVLKDDSYKGKVLRNDSLIFNTIFETEMLNIKGYPDILSFFLEIGYNIRHIDSLPSKLAIADESSCLTTINYTDDPINTYNLFIQNKQLVKTFIIAFDTIWEQATPFIP